MMPGARFARWRDDHRRRARGARPARDDVRQPAGLTNMTEQTTDELPAGTSTPVDDDPHGREPAGEPADGSEPLTASETTETADDPTTDTRSPSPGHPGDRGDRCRGHPAARADRRSGARRGADAAMAPAAEPEADDARRRGPESELEPAPDAAPASRRCSRGRPEPSGDSSPRPSAPPASSSLSPSPARASSASSRGSAMPASGSSRPATSRGAAFMAEAYGQLTGRPAVCLATRAVGAANLAIGIHTAQQDSTPMFALVGQVERNMRGREAFQEVDQVATIGGVAKWAAEITLDRGRPRRDGRSRPPGARRPSGTGPRVRTRGPARRDRPRRHAGASGRRPRARRAAGPRPTFVRCSTFSPAPERPVILAGGGVLRARGSADLLRLAELLQLPVISAWRRGDVFPNDHPLYLGMARLRFAVDRPRTACRRGRDARRRLPPEPGGLIRLRRARAGDSLGPRRRRATGGARRGRRERPGALDRRRRQGVPQGRRGTARAVGRRRGLAR